MEFGVQLSNLELERYRDLAQEAEDLGFDLVTTPDHIRHERAGVPFDPHHLAYDSLQIAAVMASATKRIRVGHLVLCNLFRHPVMTAQSLATLDHLSGGRMVVGLGTGWTESEFRTTGIPFPDMKTRLEMLDESLTCMRSLWTNETTTFEGRHYRLREAILWPKPIATLPILVGGSGKGLLRVAAKHADIVNIIAETGRAGRVTASELRKVTGDVYRAKVAFLREEAKRAGRDPKALRVSSTIFSIFLVESEAAAMKTAERLAPVFETTPEAVRASPLALVGTAETCVLELRRRIREWGVDQFIFSGGAYSALRRLGEDVVHTLRGETD